MPDASGSWSTGHPNLEAVGEALLAVHAVLLREFKAFEKRVRAMARIECKSQAVDVDAGGRPDRGAHLCSAIDDPARFKSSKQAGAHFGLTPKKYQSGETDRTGRISKIGDASVREALYQAAHVMLTKPIKGCSALKSWAMRIARRAGMRKAKVALARKLAVILHRMLADGNTIQPRWLQQPNRENSGFRAGHDTSLPEAKSLRRDDGSGQAVIREVGTQCDHAFCRLADLSSMHPIRRRPCADPVQKQVPGERMTQKGID